MELKDLEVYKLAEQLSDIIWDIVLKWDYFPRVTVGKQMVDPNVAKVEDAADARRQG